jgi:putative tricarboxylic transport membrane protein
LAATLLAALQTLLTFDHLLYLATGVGVGLVVGVIPGLGGIVGLSLLMPFLYGMDTVSALAMLVGLVAVIPTSDVFTSILMGIPGSSASQATVLDGFPMAQRGEAARALSAAFSASLAGGLIGAVILTLFVQIVRPMILTFGSAELFMLAVLGLSMVGVLSGRSLLKGLAACGLGLVFGSIGGAPATGEFRMTLGLDYLYDGLPLVIVGIAVFAFPEIIDLLRKNRAIAAGATLGGSWSQGLKDVAKNWFLCLRCAGLGSLIGAIPGLGGSVVDWIAYGHVVQTSKDKSRFGKGDVRGVIAPESANNAKEGGGLMPTLLFGIPGSGSMAVFLGGMVLLGLEAGPAMATTQLDLTYTIVWSLALANVFGTLLCIGLAKPIAQLTTVPFNYLAPFMFMVVSFAAVQETRTITDLWALLAVGVLGVLMRRFGWSRPAFLIGFVLASQAETYLNLAVQFYGWAMFERPAVLIIIAITVVSVVLGLRGRVDETLADATELSEPAAPHIENASNMPQLIFLGVLIIALCYAIVSSLEQSPLGGMFPLGASLFTLAMCAVLGASILWRPAGAATYDLEQHPRGVHMASGMWTTILWFAGFVAAASLVGFFAAAIGFFVVFLHYKTRTRWPRTLGYTLAAVAMLLALGWVLTSDFPGGLLQAYVALPWPLR